MVWTHTHILMAKFVGKENIQSLLHKICKH